MVTLKLNEQKELTMRKASITYRGEIGAEQISLTLPHTIANTPLSECVVTLNVNGEHGGDVLDVSRIMREDEEGYTATLSLTGKHTAKACALDVWVEAHKDGFCAKSNRVVIRVKPHDAIGESLPPEQVNLFSKWLVSASGLLRHLEEKIASTEDAAESARVSYECAESALAAANTACAAAEAAYLAVDTLNPPSYLEEEGVRAAETVLEHVREGSFSLAFFSDFHLGHTKRAHVRGEALPPTRAYRFTDTAVALFHRNAQNGTPGNVNFKGNAEFVQNYAGSRLVEGGEWCFQDPGTYSAYLADAPQNGIIIFSQRDQLGSDVSGDRHVVMKLKIEEDGWYFPFFSYNLYNESAGANLYLAPVAEEYPAQARYRLLSASNADRPSKGSLWENHTLWGDTPRHLQNGEYHLVFEKTNDTKGSFRYFYLDAFRLHKIPIEQLALEEPLRAAGHLLAQVKKHAQPDVVVIGGDYSNGDWSTTKEDAIRAFHTVQSALDGDLFLLGECDDAPCRDAEHAPTARDVYAHLLRQNAVKGACISGYGYGYRDFSAQKMRVIFLNTEEKDARLRAEVRDGEYNTYKNTFGVGDAQLAFLANALDVPETWGVVVCSHRAPYTIAKLRTMLEGYNQRASGDGFDFRSAQGKLWCCVFGHNHASVERTGKVLYIGCPNACDGEEGKSSDGKTYEKTPQSATASAGCVITVCPRENAVYADRVGAGFNRTF